MHQSVDLEFRRPNNRFEKFYFSKERRSSGRSASQQVLKYDQKKWNTSTNKLKKKSKRPSSAKPSSGKAKKAKNILKQVIPQKQISGGNHAKKDSYFLMKTHNNNPLKGKNIKNVSFNKNTVSKLISSQMRKRPSSSAASKLK